MPERSQSTVTSLDPPFGGDGADAKAREVASVLHGPADVLDEAPNSDLQNRKSREALILGTCLERGSTIWTGGRCFARAERSVIS